MNTKAFTDCVNIVGESVAQFEGQKVYVSTGALNVDRIDDEKTEMVDYSSKPSRANLQVREGDLLFAKMMATEKTLQIDKENEKFIYSTGFCAVRPKANVFQPECLYHVLTSDAFLKQKDKYCTGATQKSITNAGLAKIKLKVPEYQSQRRIALILSTIDDLACHRLEQIKQLDLLVKSRFVEMFGDPDHNLHHWPVTTLKEVAIGKLSYGSGAAAVGYNGYTRYVRITDITESGELNEDVKSAQSVDEKYLLKSGDVLFARTGATVGKTFMYSEKYGRCIYAGFLIRLVPNLDLVTPEYLFHFTKSEYYRQFVENTQRIVAQPNINAKEYGDLVLCLPPVALQKQFATFVAQTDKSKFEIEQGLKKAEVLKASFMQEFFDEGN